MVAVASFKKKKSEIESFQMRDGDNYLEKKNREFFGGEREREGGRRRN